jgi:ATP-dependent exoDNAse (exonuclease V) beta subunit
MAEDELRGWDTQRVDTLRREFSRQLARRGVQARELNTAAEVVAAALMNTLVDQRGRWILGAHTDPHTEYRLRVRSKDGFRTYVVDRVFRADGARWIIDYKTSRHEGSGVEEFLDRERARYAEQLKLYGEAVQSTRAGLYFPLLSGWRQWDF